MRKRSISFLMIVIWLLFGIVQPVAAQGATAKAVVLKAEGPLTPVMVTYIERGLRIAAEDNAAVVILKLNTPGGSIDLMNRIVQNIRTSSVPVVVYVSPNGAMAASAGTLITLAGHLAAMAPETAIGAASPVGGQGEDIGETMETKVKEILKATTRSLTERRGPRATELAEQSIDKARAVSAKEALEAGLIDYIATDLNDLLKQIDGQSVLVNGQTKILHTASLEQYPVANTLIEEILNMLTNPNIVFLLMSVGVQAILIELSSPGGWVAGFIGAVCLALAGYGLGILPVNWFGIVFLLIAFVLFVLDIKAPTHGALTTAGAACFIVGALVLFNSTRTPGFPTVSVPLVIGVGIFIALSFFAIMTIALRAQRVPIRTGKESLAGRTGIARDDINPDGNVQVAAELWSAELAPGSPPIQRGERVEVVAVEGLRLIVRKQN